MIAWALAAAPFLQADDMAWPKGASPQEIGRRVAEHFVLTPHGNVGRTNAVTSDYLPGDLRLVRRPDLRAIDRPKRPHQPAARRFEPLFGEDARLVPRPVNVDSTVFGSVPLELFIQTKEQRYLDMGKPFADSTMDHADGRRPGRGCRTRSWVGQSRLELAIPFLD